MLFRKMNMIVVLCGINVVMIAQENDFAFRKQETKDEVCYSVHDKTCNSKWLADVKAKKNLNGEYSEYRVNIGTHTGWFNLVTPFPRPNFKFVGYSDQQVFGLFKGWYEKQQGI